jgi:hypothetical protein
LILYFLLPASFSFTSFLPATFSCIFDYSLPLEVFIRKLNLSSSIAVVLQASQTAVFFYRISNSIVSCNSGLLRLQLSSTNIKFNCWLYFRTSQASIVFYHVSSSIVTVLPDFSGYNCFLRFFIKFNGCFSEFYLFINI